MSKTPRRSLVLLVFVAALLLSACNPGASLYFLFCPDPATPALIKKIAPEDKERDKRGQAKRVKLAIVTHLGSEIGADLLQADRELGDILAAELKARFKDNDERVDIISAGRVAEFKNQHPDWHSWQTEDIGRKLGADWVMYLEIRTLRVYAPGSFQQMFQGAAKLSLSLINIEKPDESVHGQELEYGFPSESRGGVFVKDGSSNPAQFRQLFLRYVAKRLSWQVTSHKNDEEEKDM
jgi:hypothetical protein